MVDQAAIQIGEDDNEYIEDDYADFATVNEYDENDE